MPHLTSADNKWAVAGGLFYGMRLSLFGGGGSQLSVPILISLVGLSRARVAMATTVVGVAFTAMFSAVGHARHGRIRWSIVL